MIFSSEEVLPIAESTGFRAEMIEKVLHLLNLLDKLNRHPMLKRIQSQPLLQWKALNVKRHKGLA